MPTKTEHTTFRIERATYDRAADLITWALRKRLLPSNGISAATVLRLALERGLVALETARDSESEGSR